MFAVEFEGNVEAKPIDAVIGIGLQRFRLRRAGSDPSPELRQARRGLFMKSPPKRD